MRGQSDFTPLWISQIRDLRHWHEHRSCEYWLAQNDLGDAETFRFGHSKKRSHPRQVRKEDFGPCAFSKSCRPYRVDALRLRGVRAEPGGAARGCVRTDGRGAGFG